MRSDPPAINPPGLPEGGRVVLFAADGAPSAHAHALRARGFETVIETRATDPEVFAAWLADATVHGIVTLAPPKLDADALRCHPKVLIGPGLRVPGLRTFATLDAALAEAAAPRPMPPTLRAALALGAEVRARHPEADFDGYGKGEDRYVCTSYAIEALRRAGVEITPTLSDGIHIERFSAPLTEAVARGDAEIQGIAWALPQAGAGRAIAVADLRPGDFAQYWYGLGDGIAGHVAQVAAVVPGGVRMHGAHRSTRGLAVHPEVIRTDNKLAFFSVRPAVNEAGDTSGPTLLK
ncbi:MAG: hypothetical protein KC620_05365 [Myxococcales bacterium]|nr:hypothetical protein [Myxococcales bacterium]